MTDNEMIIKVQEQENMGGGICEYWGERNHSTAQFVGCQHLNATSELLCEAVISPRED